MPGMKGRDIALVWNAAAVAGVREKGITLNGEPVDVSSDDSAGWRELLADVSGEDQIDISVSGVTIDDNQLKVDWFAGNRTQTVSVTYPGNDVISGTFFLSSYADTGVYNDATTFEATLVSSGVVTYTPGP